MMNLQLHIQIIGYIFIVLAFTHLVFPKKFAWRENLKPLSLLNRQLMYVHTFFIALFVLLNGLLFISCADELLSGNRLAKFVNAGFFIFWFLRLLFQHFVYARALWVGKRVETGWHIFFSMLWLYIVLVLGFVIVS